MTIYKLTNGQIADADEVMSNFNYTLQHIAVDKINQIKGGGATYTDQIETSSKSITNILDATGSLETGSYNSSTLYNSDSYAWFDGTLNVIYAGSYYDNYSDASIDTTKWTVTASGTGGTTTEVANSYIEGYAFQGGSGGTVSIDSKGSSSQINLLPAGTNSECIFYMNIAVDSDSASPAADGYVALKDDLGNSVTLKDFISGDGQSFTGILRLVIDSSNCRIYTDIDTYTDVDITSLVGTSYWYLRWYATISYGAGSNWARIRVYPLVHVNQTTLSQSMETVRTAVTDTVTKGFLFSDNASNGATITYGISADIGSNFTTVSDSQITAIGTSGSTLSSKYTFTGSNIELIPKIDSNCLLYSD